MDRNRYEIACINELSRREKLSYGQLLAKYPDAAHNPDRYLDERTKKRLLRYQEGRR